VLAAHDWDLSHPANEQQAAVAYTPCHADAPIFRYKVYNGVVYADHDHHKDGRYSSYRQAFLEQLVLAVWLYSDFPDVDLIVDYTGMGGGCRRACKKEQDAQPGVGATGSSCVAVTLACS
jgi:hypothetical protein